jgi:hypothetical protein
MAGKPDGNDEKTDMKHVTQQAIQWFFQEGIVKRKQQAQDKEWACVEGWMPV